jgi:hypothetical protein
MPPEHPSSFGGGATESTLNPFILIAMIIAIVLILSLPRKFAGLPLLLITFMVPLGQSVVLGGAHFFVSRIIILFGLLRMLSSQQRRGRLLAGGYNSIDRALLWCTICQVVAVVLLFQNVAAINNQCGFLIDVLGAYFLLRFFIHDKEDLFRILKCLAVVAVIGGVGTTIEQTSMFNVFSLIGGAIQTPEIREGRIRAQGFFAHPLLAGTFGATLFPLYLSLWKSGKAPISALLGALGTTVMTINSYSSTPLLAYAGGIVAVCLWPVRRQMRTVRWVILSALLSLAIVMKAPVWFLMTRIDLTGGSSGYHRAQVVDQFVNHFSDWWLMGVKETGSWGWDMWDTQNQYVNIGQTGGLVAFVLFITMIVLCFRTLGNAQKATVHDPKQEWLLWIIGSSFFAHLVAFFGVNYFDQSRVNWLALLAMICAVTASGRQQIYNSREVQPDLIPATHDAGVV